jgi:hypothetical protein
LISKTFPSTARKWHQRTGRRLFGQTSDKKPLRLVGNQTVAGDLAYLTYQPVSEA